MWHPEHEPRPIPRPHRRLAPVVDTALQRPAFTPFSPPAATTFEGTGDGYVGAAGATFSVQSAPPDSDGDVGPNHYISIVNSGFTIVSKNDGHALLGPVQTNTLFTGFGGQCEAQDDGDGVVLYDPIADRWFLTQFAVSAPDPKYYQCVAVSKTNDPTGQWYLYAFDYTTFNDYGKFGVWPDGYYATYNMFDGSGTSLGAEICAFDRAKMLLGQPAIAVKQVCASLPNNGGILPADMDGTRKPPAGSPNYVIGFGTDVLQFWTFKVDWTPATPTGTLSAETDIPVASFTQACASDGTCIVQPTPASATAQPLDSLADRMMFRLAYRNFGDHESLVTNHTVVAGTSSGIRWYELRDLGSASGPTVYQQGTFAPDTNWRWMGSIAMDGTGNIAAGYSISSGTMAPSLAIAGRLVGDALGEMGQGERQMFAGSGSQIGNGGNGSQLTRWGDYSSMSVDPSDDCTFWYVGEYLPGDGVYNWHQRVGSFKFPNCTTAPAFSLALDPAAQTVAPGASVVYSVHSAAIGGSTAQISVSIGTLPTGITGSFDTTSVTPGGDTALTLTADSTAPTRDATTFTVSGTSSDGTAGATATVAVSTGVTNTFSIAIAPSTSSIRPTGTTTYTISTTVTGGTAESIALTLTGLPSTITGSFSPPSVTAGGTSTLTLTSTGAAAGSTTFNVFSDSASHTEFVASTVVVSANDFGIAITPSSRNIVTGQSDTYTVTTSVTAGIAENVQLAVAGLPAGVSGSFAPAAVTAGGSATLTLTVISTATPVAATSFTLTGTSASLVVHSASATVAVVAPPANDFTLTLSPSSATLYAGRTKAFTVATAATTGTAESIAFSASGLPANVTAAFSPATVTAGGSSTMTLAAAGTAAAGTAIITVTGTAASTTHSATASLTTAVPPPAPTVSITSPAAGASVSGSVSITATATAGTGTTLSTLEIYLDGSLLGSSTNSPATQAWDTTGTTNGQHSLTAKAVDATGGSTTSAAVAVTVANIAAPVVSVTAPTAGATVTGTVAVTGTATGTRVNQIFLYVDGSQIGVGTSSPLTVQWDSKTVSDGEHALTARAKDTAGHDVTSSATSVTVSNASTAKGGGCSSTAPGGLGFLALLVMGAFRLRKRGREAPES